MIEYRIIHDPIYNCTIYKSNTFKIYSFTELISRTNKFHIEFGIKLKFKYK